MKTSQFLKKRGSLLLSTLLFTTLIVPLSTVGFVSLQSYKGDAHNVVMHENVWYIYLVINTKVASAVDPANLIDTTTIDKTVQVSAQKTIFWASNTENITTKAWDVQWIALNELLKKNMKDKNGNYPLVGFASTSSKSKLQVATTIDDQIYVKGDFTPDAWENAAKWLIQDPSGTSELVDGTYGRHR